MELTFSNLWSATSTTFSAVSVGVQQSGANVVPGTIVPVTFKGARSVTMAPHAQVTSDPVAMTVSAGESLAISIAVLGSATVSVHYCCYGHIDSFATSDGVGNVALVPSALKFNPLLTGTSMRWLSEIAVLGSNAPGTIVGFGDSITDGYGNVNNGFSWVNALQSRINQLPASQRMSVVNEGVSGNTLTVFPPGASFALKSGGLPGVTRLNDDALSLAGAKDVVLLLGTNDIWFGAGGETGYPIPPYGTAASIEGGMHDVVAMTHARGLKIYGITLLPRSTTSSADHDLPEYWSPAEQATLSAVNSWMLSPASGFDGVINLNALMSDVYNGDCRPSVPFAPYFNTDHLHPNVAGETVMADAISTVIFGLPEAPQVPQLVSATPTVGCPAATLASQVLAAGRQPSPTTTTSTSTTTPTTTTTLAPPVGLLGGHLYRYALYLVLALIILSLAALVAARRREARRRARRRQRTQRVEHSRFPPPSRRPPPRSNPPRR